MKDLLQYKEFFGSVHFNPEDSVFFGKIEGINDIVTFEGKTVDEIKKSFKEAIDDYLEICKQTGKEPCKSYKGSFNIRITPELHKKAVQKSISRGVSLNQFVQKAIEHELADTNAD
ncbi:MAG TPA: type II toxin-antitoxin system HicB family antitoxin [Spirochaetota bacterium]|nr:type II toxin-antitoxin system HicB family antitoxin [Spirochaetota bacterium]HPI91037.1 type II toxin-antitoxin system HicB family antitoxin [Spirochaetota bacterium]HPR47298.1 type II toxin-antitoxin system HicB family antitoxin [Spirochaetota bacterium]